MAHRRVQDRMNKRSSRVIESFYGCHYGYGKADQPSSFADVCDFHFVHKKPHLREGMRKNALIGSEDDIAEIMHITIGAWNLLGEIVDGELNVYPVSDIIEGIRRYYTWQEVQDTFTWDTIDEKTWRELYEGRTP